MRTAFLSLILYPLIISALGVEPQITDSRTAGHYRISVTAAPLDTLRDGLGRNQYHSATLHGRYIHGTDGGVPRTVIREVSVAIGDKHYTLPPDLYNDLADPLLGPNFYRHTFTVSETWRYVIIAISGGDGAGGYECRWRISKSRIEVSRSVESESMQGFPPYGSPEKLVPVAKN